MPISSIVKFSVLFQSLYSTKVIHSPTAVVYSQQPTINSIIHQIRSKFKY